jgi:hypothetical protein
LDKEKLTTILWAPILSQSSGGYVNGAIGLICLEGANAGCSMDLNIEDKLEDFEALYDEDFQLVQS